MPPLDGHHVFHNVGNTVNFGAIRSTHKLLQHARAFRNQRHHQHIKVLNNMIKQKMHEEAGQRS